MGDETENQPPAAGEEAGEKPVKKKTSVKVVRRVKSKKSEKGERPELAPPPPTIEEQQPAAQAEAPPPPPPKRAAEPAPSPRAAERPVERRVSSKKRTQRSGSNVFAMFTQNQIHQFKEAFSFIDQDKDGIISKADIRSSFDALGRLCSDKELEFLSVFGDRIQGTDEEDVVMQAFGRYDEGDGFCKEDK
jgi:Ca2+-binding EF-hand superfamily protein